MNNLTPLQEVPVRFSPDGLYLNGKPEIILCSSLFYFRIPRALWRERLKQVKAFGYNCIDVYFPWNHHETEEGIWDFAGEKDAECFLREATAAGLWVIARPGPYICSEWDGGGLPAYLFAKDEVRLRQNDSAFLVHTARWYERILPIIGRHQWGKGGTVIAVQLDNELDFYSCQDPQGYISALRDMALYHRISVPLVACAGQGGVIEAGGVTEGVVPACNFYPNDFDPSFEDKVSVYKKLLAGLDLPLMVTETNRSHFLLRRLLSCGVKLLGPYLQSSGTNFGFTNAVNNWGAPFALLTSDYDFGGMISPEGLVREEALEGRLLSRVVECFDQSLAEAAPAAGSPGKPYRLDLKNGGQLLFLCSTAERDAETRIGNGDGIESFPRFTKLVAKARRCPILPLRVPLKTWGSEDGTIVYATAELAMVRKTPDRMLFVFHTEHEAEISLAFSQPAQMEHCGMKVHEQNGGRFTYTFSPGQTSSVVLRQVDGTRIEICGMDRSEVLRLAFIDEKGNFHYDDPVSAHAQVTAAPESEWSMSHIDPPFGLMASAKPLGDCSPYLEKNGIYRGFAGYGCKAELPDGTSLLGVLLRNASDVVSVYSGGTYWGTVVPGGGSSWLPSPDFATAVSEFAVRAEIWGHSNFDDARLPGLRLNAMKGLAGLTAVTRVSDLTPNWRVRRISPKSGDDGSSFVGEMDELLPVVSWGGWLSTRFPLTECYLKEIRLSGSADSWTLHIPGIETTAEIYVNGRHAGTVNPLDPYVEITPFVTSGSTAALALVLNRTPVSRTGEVRMYEGNAAKHWTLSSAGERELVSHAEEHRSLAVAAEGTASLRPGEMSWLYAKLPDSGHGAGWRVYVSGTGLKMTVVFNGRIVGRLWMAGGDNRPIFSGGAQDSFYLPGPWFRESDNGLAVMLEATGSGQDGVLKGLRFEAIASQRQPGQS